MDTSKNTSVQYVSISVQKLLFFTDSYESCGFSVELPSVH